MTISAMSKPKLKNDFFLGDQPVEPGIGSTGGIGVSSTFLSAIFSALLASVFVLSIAAFGLFKSEVISLLVNVASWVAVLGSAGVLIAESVGFRPSGLVVALLGALLGAFASSRRLVLSSFMTRS